MHEMLRYNCFTRTHRKLGLLKGTSINIATHNGSSSIYLYTIIKLISVRLSVGAIYSLAFFFILVYILHFFV